MQTVPGMVLGRASRSGARHVRWPAVVGVGEAWVRRATVARSAGAGGAGSSGGPVNYVVCASLQPLVRGMK